MPFGAASEAGGPITASVDGAKAQGYTPIAYSLEQAANDFASNAKERVIVLVSDGKETCQVIRWWRGSSDQPTHHPGKRKPAILTVLAKGI